MADSASTIPSVSVMGGGALRSSDAMNKILDIVGNMGKSRRHHHHHHNHHGKHQENVAVQRRAFNMYINKGPDSISTLSVRVGHHGFDVAKGSDGNDTIAYANSSNDYIITQIRGGGGDDVISLSSTAYGPQVAFGGAGNDTIVVSARTAFAFGGEGDDVIAAAGLYVIADGGEGDDVITASGEVVALVAGGKGDDTITVNATSVGVVRGGAGDDVITVTSDEQFNDWDRHDHGFGFGFGYDGFSKPAIIDGGKGNDIINIDGQARVIHRAGDGQDVISITDTTEFTTFGEEWFDGVMLLDEATFSYENGELTVTFEGRDESLTIRSAVGELSWEITSDRTFIVKINEAAEPPVDVEASASANIEQTELGDQID